ncbi:MAG: hypothetical protein Dasosvirus11_7 [Dasosvirus sp.]|uniref:dUTP diphosphatase n=1 Tax=Dasosvirus sp. TaxID=2487764 RepID=A0A3G4ZRR1_9VIRU|nr:MAG: hypothetical protein Dasosvirus11_7 [Dasosvirus sp.]
MFLTDKRGLCEREWTLCEIFWLVIFIVIACTICDKKPSNFKLHVCPYNDEYQNAYYKNYKNKYLGDSGVDLVLSYNVSLESNRYTVIEYFSTFAMTNKWNQRTSFYMFARSSLSRYPLVFVNGVGVIDAGFQGNLSTTIYNPNNYTINLTKGMKVVQICSPDLSRLDVTIDCQIESYGTRGNKGFGSSG